jgi:hypothetical protein
METKKGDLKKKNWIPFIKLHETAAILKKSILKSTTSHGI